jgi:hypothetical protein
MTPPVHVLASDLLEEAEALLASSVTGRDMPARRYVSHGEPPVEWCPGLLAVWTGPLTTRQVGPSTASMTSRAMTYNVDVWRCWPTSDAEAPPPDELTSAALALADDLDRLSGGLARYLADRCGLVEWQPALALGPSGGMAGWRLTVAVEVG